MGIIVDAEAMGSEVTDVTAKLSAVKDAIVACKGAIQAFMSDNSLSGNAYLYAKAFFVAYLYAFDAINAQLGSVVNAGANIMNLLGTCPDLGSANEDELISENEELKKRRAEYEYLANNACYQTVVDGVTQYLPDYRVRSGYREYVSIVDAKLAKNESILEQLRRFNSSVVCSGMEEACETLKTSIDAICSGGNSLYAPGTSEFYRSRFQEMQLQLEKLQQIKNNPGLGGAYGYGVLYIDGEEYSVYVPDCEYWQDDDSWETVATKHQELPEKMNWGKFLATLLSDNDCFEATPVYTGPYQVSDGLTLNGSVGGGYFAAILAKGLSAYAGARETSYINVCTQKKDDQNRIIITYGCSAFANFYSEVADGKWRSSSVEVPAYLGLDFKYLRSSYKFDKQHQENRDFLYLWSGPDGCAMEKVITYPEDCYYFSQDQTFSSGIRHDVDLGSLPSGLDQATLNAALNEALVAVDNMDTVHGALTEAIETFFPSGN